MAASPVSGPGGSARDGEDAPPEPEERKDEVEEGAPAWTTTFGDLMSLLLTFFILLYAMSELKVERFTLATQSLSQALGGTAVIPPDTPTGLVADTPGIFHPEDGDEEEGITQEEREVLSAAELEMDDLLERLEELIEEQGLQDVISVEQSDEGVRLSIVASTLFPTGSAIMIEEKRWVLRCLAEVTSGLEFLAVVSGHTDNVPIQTPQFPSNWELSAARAGGVARELAQAGHSPDYLKVEAFGEYRPIDTNATEAGRARNRRVEILYSRTEIIARVERRLREMAP